MNDINYIVSSNIKQLRKERQMTLQDLSKKSGVSISMLGGVERGDTNPTITILDKIAYGFKIPLAKLIEEDRDSIYYVPAENKILYKEYDQYKVLTVFKYNKDYGFQILELHMGPESERISQGHNKGVVEFLMINEGALKLIVENKTFELNTGDSIRFEADKPHQLINESQSSAKITNLIYYKQD